MRIVLLFIASFLFCKLTYAENAWELSGYGALNLSSQANYRLFSSGNDIVYDASGRPSGAFGLEADRSFTKIFWLGFILDETYFASNEVSGTDSQLSILLMPKIKVDLDPRFKFWAGLGFGTANTSFGTTRTEPNAVFKMSSRSTSSFAISPRIGLDYAWNEFFFTGLQLGFLANTASNAEASASGTSANGTFRADVQHSFWSLGIRLGFVLKDKVQTDEEANVSF